MENNQVRFLPEDRPDLFTGFVVLVDGEVAGTLMFANEQAGIIAALQSNFTIMQQPTGSMPRIGSIWNGTEFVYVSG